MAANNNEILLDDLDVDSDAKNGREKGTSKHSPKRQSWTLFKRQIGQLVFTVLLVVCLIVILKVYSDMQNVNQHKKYEFNAIATALTILLSLNFFEAFKTTAKILRWRFLADRRSTVREADLILRGESLMDLTSLMLESTRKPIVFLVCFSWILINLVAQSIVAASSLTFSWETGTNSSGTVLSPDIVDASTIDCYYDGDKCLHPSNGLPPGINHTLAHTYGESANSRTSCPYKSDNDIFRAPQNCDYFTGPGDFAYRYKEFNPGDNTRNYPHLTNRLVKASAGQCFEYDVPNTGTEDSPDGMSDTWVYNFSNQTNNGSIAIPKIYTAWDSTTYVYNGTNDPASANETAPASALCGPRCVWLYAYRGLGPSPKRNSTVFQCPITISNVSNVQDPAHELPDDMARVAAASVALTGRWRSINNINDWRQFQLYSFGSYWETQDMSPQEVGARMAEFSIASLSAMAELNPFQPLDGQLPTLGYNLSVHWPLIIAFGAGVAGCHAAILVLTLMVSRGIVVADESFFVIARLLHGLVGGSSFGAGQQFPGKASNGGNDYFDPTDGKTNARLLQAHLDRSEEGTVRVRYGFGSDPDANDDHVLMIGKDNEVIR